MDVRQLGGNPYSSVSPETAVPATSPREAGLAQASAQPPQAVTRAELERTEAQKTAPQGDEDHRKASREDMDKVLEKLNIVMNAMSIQAKFEVHQPTKEIMVRVVNVESGQLIREIPPKKILDMVAQMQELVGLLLDERG